jgi:NAD-dependent dihydropyrimidine dehydrogenase PreA subunit
VSAAPTLPVLDPSRCTGCGDCVAVCPTACLEMTGPLPWLPRPGSCIACGACEWVCIAAAVCVTPATAAGTGW